MHGFSQCTSLRYVFIVILLFSFGYTGQAQNIEKKIVLQGFWWNFYNDQYFPNYADYLAELAPRLKAMGIDAVWIPPSVKNNGASGSSGYAPFDHYDLGDKYQKGEVSTRLGNKDELLRMVAVFHANGIEVIQDIVPNHVIGAGDLCGDEGIDSGSGNDPYTIFRYTCFKTPAGNCTSEYQSREGRWPKNWQNFHGNSAHNCNSGDICSQDFGPDICYWDGAKGQSTPATDYDPDQNTYSPYNNGGTGSGNGYMRKHFREWLIWSKKQIGFDGVRIDAVKHFQSWAAEDFLSNIQHQAGFANGGDAMFAVGEWVGGAGDLDNWIANVNNRAGTFDFGLRSGLLGMADGGGFYNMANLPGTQQGTRYVDLGGVRIHRTVPFVNNHDTFRPCVDVNGNYTSTWGGDACGNGNELGTHISPENWRMPLAYAAAFAVDGNPQIFFEDLFDLNNSNRYSHDPASSSELPERDWLVNLIWCHQNLGFKYGDYSKPTEEANTFFPSGSSADDLLIIERYNRAFIALNDNGTNAQGAWVDTDWTQGTVLKDYTGQIANTVTVQGPSGGSANRVFIEAPAVGNLSSGQHGYAIWAPSGSSGGYTLPAIYHQQEWEMADDLGDSHCSSLMQGGQLPAASTAYRVMGKIFIRDGSDVNYELYQETTGQLVVIEIYDLNGNRLYQSSGTNTFTGSYTSNLTGWHIVKIRHGDWSNSACMPSHIASSPTAQKVWIKINYEAPPDAQVSAFSASSTVSFWTGAIDTDWSNCKNWLEGNLPAANSSVIIPPEATVNLSGVTTSFDDLQVACGAMVSLSCNTTLSIKGDWENDGTVVGGTIKMVGNTAQNIKGSSNTFCILEANNGNTVQLHGNVTVTQELKLTDGIVKTGAFSIAVTNASATAVTGGDASSYIEGTLQRAVNASAAYDFPLGDATTGYNPASILVNNAGSATTIAGSFSNANISSVPVSRSCDVNGDNQADGVVYDCAKGGWNFSADDDTGINYTITLSPSSTLTGTCTFYRTIGKDGSFDCNEGLSKTYTSFSTFDVVGKTTNAIVLPVEWVSFKGELLENGAGLSWIAAEDESNASYEVQRSRDGRFFETLADIPASKDAGTFSYKYLDENFQNQAYYRIKQIDYDAQFSYSETIFLQKDSGENWFELFPNPVDVELKLVPKNSIEIPTNIRCTLFDLNGKRLFVHKGNHLEIQSALNKKLYDLQTNIYFIELETERKVQRLRFVKK